MSMALELLRASAEGQRELEAFLETHPLTPEFASGVRELFAHILNTGALEQAELAASVAGLLWALLGDPHEMVRGFIDHLQIRFKRAQAAETYAEVRAAALEMLRRITDLQDQEFPFRLAVLAADASYFGYRAGGGQPSPFSLPLVLSDLVAAANRATRVSGSIFYPRFASLAAAVIQTALSELSEDEHGHVDRSLRHLATRAPFSVPHCAGLPRRSRQGGAHRGCVHGTG
jgi:hypothetical protein